ncbi:hypothetical protein GALMADRAFT_1334411 [Galerina marginata CBS 339.88]|uniref:Uncharacterized protein n=1 Tax=Galerina marginata (strain CBS 339.88) TaxID=685588 RepID=A0A067SVI6_GALM3|nr:hypothetical protein GALMADRAFT_1334411 [Galerina marginata CBS 339.88]
MLIPLAFGSDAEAQLKPFEDPILDAFWKNIWAASDVVHNIPVERPRANADEGKFWSTWIEQAEPNEPSNLKRDATRATAPYLFHIQPANSISQVQFNFHVDKDVVGSTTGKIQTCLIEYLTKASPAQLETLLSVFSPLLSQARTIKHCLRCHQEYSDNENHKAACKIEHNEDGESERTMIGYEDMTTTLLCCGISFEDKDGHPGTSCIVAFHTTNLEDVEYYCDEDDEHEDNNGNNGNKGTNENVITCLKAECLDDEDEEGE